MTCLGVKHFLASGADFVQCLPILLNGALQRMETSLLSLPLSSPVALFGVVMLIITAAPIVAKRLQLPGVVGIILMSAILGPGALGVLARNDQVVLLGTIGLLYLIFAAGLSLDLNQFMRLKYRALTFGLLSFSIPMVLGYLGCRHFLGFSQPASLLIGGVVGTHTLLAYPAARLLGLTKNRAVIMTVGATIITDALGLTVLAIVVKSTAGDLGALFWAGFAATLIIYVLAVLWVVPLVGRWFFRTFPNDPNGEMAFCLAILFTVAIFTEMVGLAPLIGAFLTGLALNKLIPSSGTLMSRIQFFGDSLFIPFFLVSVGLLVDFRALFSSLGLWFSALVFMAALYAGKFVAAKASQYIFRNDNDEAMVTFGLATPQAAATLAVTLVGFDELGIFTVETVNAVVLMILVSCVVGPMLVDRYGRSLSAKAKADDGGDDESPQRILIPLSNPSTAQTLMNIALSVRAPDSEEPIYPLAVASGGNDVYADVARAEKLLVGAVSIGTAAAVPVTPVTRVDMKPLDGMVRAIHEMRISQVIIGWHGRRTARERIFGSILDQLLEGTSLLTMVCRVETAPKTTERVLLLLPPRAHLSPGYREALSTVKNLASRLKCNLFVITTEESRERAERDLARARPEAKAAFHAMKRWSALLAHLGKLAEPHDMIVLLSAREKTASWRPDLNGLPSRIVNKLPEANLITVYPAEDMVPVGYMGNRGATAMTRRKDTPVHSQLNPLLASLSERSFRRRLPRKRPPAVLRAMVRRAFAESLHLSKAAEGALVRKLLQFELELAPGVLLLHAPLKQLTGPVLLVGHSAEGIEFDDAGEPVRVIFLLLSPEGFPPEKHLANLAIMARIATHGEAIAVVEKAEKADSLGSELSRLLEESGPAGDVPRGV